MSPFLETTALETKFYKIVAFVAMKSFHKKDILEKVTFS
jgi:hypothetical protein